MLNDSTLKFCPACGVGWSIDHSAEKPSVENQCTDGYPTCKCGWKFFDNPVPVVAAVVVRDGQVILARNCAWPDGMFGLITGYLEKHEDPIEAVAREVNEELGLSVKHVRFISHEMFKANNQLLIGYEVVAEGQVTLNHELAEYKCIPMAKLKPWPFGTGKIVNDWINLQPKPAS